MNSIQPAPCPRCGSFRFWDGSQCSHCEHQKPLGFRLSVTIGSDAKTVIRLDDVSPDITVAELIVHLLGILSLPPEKNDWCLTCKHATLHLESQLRFCLPYTQEHIELVFERQSAQSTMQLMLGFVEEPIQDPAQGSRLNCIEDGNLDDEFIAIHDVHEDVNCDLLEGLDARTSEMMLEEEDLHSLEELEALDEGDLETLELDDCVAVGAVSKQQSKKNKSVTRTATVRYYRRMNPERIYPMLVIITKQMIEKVQKNDTDQLSSNPFKVDTNLSVEIEPVFPGCDCYPSKLVACLSGGELTATFRVLPRVIGSVDGASVTIRQNHNLLAEIPLDVKVSQRFWVFFWGVITFVLPVLSAILKHFGLDFDTQKDQGFNLYVSAARLVFDQFSPLALNISLALVTGVIWWITRPQVRDVFWDVKKISPAEKLDQIANTLEEDSQTALKDLADLLNAYPDYQPARLFFANCQYDSQDYRSALKEYCHAFKLGTAKALHYHKASVAASKLGKNETALRILQDAEKALLAHEITSVMLYNFGCYHALLGNPNNAMDYLTRAVAAGYTKAESYHKDPDLALLRNRPDFKRLLAEDLTVHFVCPKCSKKLRANVKIAREKRKCPSCRALLSVPVFA